MVFSKLGNRRSNGGCDIVEQDGSIVFQNCWRYGVDVVSGSAGCAVIITAVVGGIIIPAGS